MTERGKALLLAVVAAGSAVLATSGAAQADPAGRTPSTRSGPHCTFGQDEQVQCVRVTVRMDRAPAVGATARISIDVAAQATVDGARIESDLASILRWVTPPAGLAARRVASAVPQDGGAVDRAAGQISLRKGQTLRLSGTVAGAAPGDAAVQVRVLGPSHTAVDAAANGVFVTVGSTAASSYLGSRDPRGFVAASAPVPAGTRIQPATSRPYRKVGVAGGTGGDIHPDALTCFKGSFNYVDQTGATRPSVNLQVQLRAKGFFGDTTLSTDVTDENGNYRLCSTSAAGNDDYIRFITENGQWAVRDYSDNNYQFDSRTFNDVGNGTTTDVGGLQPSDSKFFPALHAFDEANDAKMWTPGACWNANDHDCRLIPFRWSFDPAKQAANNNYDWGNRHISLRTLAPNSRSVVVHELGHAVQANIYRDNRPDTPNCSPHFLNKTSSPGCAWVEGFADWYQAAVYNDPEYVDSELGLTIPLETPTWGTVDPTQGAWDNGDGVEARVAGAMNDIADVGFEQYWDNYGEGAPGHLWDTLLKHRSANFHDFWNQRGQDGFDVSDGPQGSLYQNTIDYGFRNPLAPYSTLTRPTDPAAQNFHYRTSVVFWSVVAARPPAGGAVEVDMYGDHDQTQLLAKSAGGTDEVPFVAVDSNHRPLGDYYPRVNVLSGAGQYQVELADGAHLMSPSEQIAMTAPNDVVVERDLCVPAGTKTTITATPSDPGQDAELFLMASDPNQSSTWVQPRSFAAASATGAGPGQPESFTYTTPANPADACFGVVLINKAGSGTYTMTHS